MIIETADTAAARIKRGDTIAFSGGGYRSVAESMLTAIGKRAAEKTALDLTVITISMIERTRGGVGGVGTGLNRLAKKGLVDTFISGSFSRSRDREINSLIHDGDVRAYNLPMGTIVEWLRSIGAGRHGLFTEVGLETFVDPRVEGGRVNTVTRENISRVVHVEGVEMIFYPRREVNVGILKAQAADERGNLYFDGDAYDHGSIDVAMAAHNSGGTVIAEVSELIKRGDRHARFVRVPGSMVDVVVHAKEAEWEDERAPVFSGAAVLALDPPSPVSRPRDVIATLAVDLLEEGNAVNVGAGIPMYDVPEAARRLGRDDLYFTVEHGPAGGWPQVGGVSRNPEAILPQLDVFEYYEGGGPDVSVLSFGQIDREGNVNVSRFGSMMPGCGGFPNIAHGVRRLIFCGTLTTGGLDLRMTDGALSIVTEGRITRFVDRVDQVTFNAARALRAGHTITVVTERAVFEVQNAGFVLVAIAPGIDLQSDVLDQIDFEVSVSSDLRELPADLYRAEPR